MSKPEDDDKISHTMDATKYLMASLEADLYGTKRKPYAGLMTLLAKLRIKSAMLDNRPLQISSLQDMLKDVRFDMNHLKKQRFTKK